MPDLFHQQQSRLKQAHRSADDPRGAGLVRPHTLTIKTVASHPIVSQLGLRAPSFETGIGWWIGLDFVMGNGITIWEAG